MNTLKKIYRLIAAFTMVLLVGTIVLPTGIAAANLYCDICDVKMQAGVYKCCTTVEMNCHQEQKKERQDCDQQAFCEQIVDSNLSDIPAVIQSTKLVIAAKLSDELTTIEENDNHPPVIRDESLSLHHHPPIFLLNSTFLN